MPSCGRDQRVPNGEDTSGDSSGQRSRGSDGSDRGPFAQGANGLSGIFATIANGASTTNTLSQSRAARHAPSAAAAQAVTAVFSTSAQRDTLLLSGSDEDADSSATDAFFEQFDAGNLTEAAEA